MTAKIIQFKAKAEPVTLDGHYMGFDSCEELLQVVKSSPNNSEIFSTVADNFGENFRLAVVENVGLKMYGSFSRFLMTNKVVVGGEVLTGVYEIHSGCYSLYLLGVYDSEGKEVGGTPWKKTNQ